MRRTRMVLSIAAVLVLSAGLVVGRLLPRGGQPPVGRPGPNGRGWFIDALDLSAEQRKQMDGIWADTRGQIGRAGEQRHELDHRRDLAIRGLIPADRLAAYDKLWADYRADRSRLDADRERLVHEANDKSRSLLTDPQKARWDAMTKDMHDRHDNPHDGPPHNPGGRPGPVVPPVSSSSRPG